MAPTTTLDTTTPAVMVAIVPKEGDRIYYRRRGEAYTYVMRIEGISDRQDFGYWRVYDSH